MESRKKRNMFILFLIAYMLVFNIVILSKVSYGFTGAFIGPAENPSTDMLILIVFNIAIILLFTLSYSAHSFFHEKESKLRLLSKINDKPARKNKR